MQVKYYKISFGADKCKEKQEKQNNSTETP